MTKTTTNKTNTKYLSCGICNPAFPNLGICNPAFTFIHPHSSVESVEKLHCISHPILKQINPCSSVESVEKLHCISHPVLKQIHPCSSVESVEKFNCISHPILKQINPRSSVQSVEKLHSIFLFLILLFTTISCTAYKKVPYLTDEQADTIYQSPALQEPVVQPGDQLTIAVLPGNITDQDNVKAFNLPLANKKIDTDPTKTGGGSQFQTYQVAPDGTIQFPQLGTIKIGGLTRDQLEAHIKTLISPAYIKETPIVTSRFVNYTISVLGEVQNPGVFKIDNATINIFQALALAGDMTLYGERHNVKLMRFDRNGEKNMIILDLQDAKLLASPFFELRQNDVLYVEANKSKSNTRDLTGIEGMVFSSISSVLNAAGIVVKSVKK